MTPFHDFWSAIGPIAAAIWLGTFALLGFVTTATGIVDGYLNKRSHRFGMYYAAAITNATLSSTLLAALYQSGGKALGLLVVSAALVGEILVWTFVAAVAVTHVAAGPTIGNKVRRGTILTIGTALFIWQTARAYYADQVQAAGAAMLLLSLGISIPVMALAVLALWREAPRFVSAIEKGDDVEHGVTWADPFTQFVRQLDSSLRAGVQGDVVILTHGNRRATWRKQKYFAGVQHERDSVQLWIGIDEEVTRVFIEPMTTAAARRAGIEFASLFSIYEEVGENSIRVDD